MNARTRLGSIAAVLLAGSLASQASAQFGGRGLDPAAMRDRMLQQVKDDVAFTDEEWGVVQPKLWKVVGLQIETGTGSLGNLTRLVRGFGRGRGGANGQDPNALMNQMVAQLFFNGRPSLAMTKRQELETAVSDVNSTPQLLAVKLEEYRSAVSKAREQLLIAQEDLRGVLTFRQEAILMEQGFLE
jgi:hypothetical protein